MKIEGKGSLYFKKDGVWTGRFSLGPDPERPGKYLLTPKKTFYVQTEWEAKRELEAYRRELEENGIPDSSVEYLSGYADRWLELRKGTHKSPRTAEREVLDVRHIKELFPKVKVAKLTPPIIKTAYADARESGRFDKELFQINKRLRQILNEAVEDGMMRKNPALKVIVPKPTPEPKDYLDPERLALFNEALLALPLCGEMIGTQMLLRTGMRPGEMHGSSWGSLDEERSRLFIGEQFSNDLELRAPKSKASKDWVVFDDDFMNMLKEWKEYQAGYFPVLGLTQDRNSPIVSNSDGKRFDPTNFGRWFRNFCVDNGFGEYETVTKTFVRNGKTIKRGKGYKGLCPNMFRDIQATMQVGYLNIDPRTLQARMRHTDAKTSLQFYTHLVPENEYKAAAAFGALLKRDSA